MAVILVATTTVGWKCNGRSELAWLDNAEALADSVSDHVRFFAALECDARGREPFAALEARLAAQASSQVWTFGFDDGADEITHGNRLSRICTGRNVIAEYGVRSGAEWILHVDSDTIIGGDALAKLMEVDWPIIGGHVPNYCMSGPEVPQRPSRIWLEGGRMWPLHHRHGEDFGFPVQQHWNTAGFLLVHRSLFLRLRWRSDPDAGMSDDPCYAADALALGWPTLVRHDVIGTHIEPLVDIAARGGDRTVYR